MIFKDKVAAQLPVWRERITKLIRENGRVKIDEVDISQVYGGMRDVKSMVTDISYLDPQRGIRLRGYSIPEILAELPKPKDMEVPPVGGLYYLLVVGELPNLTEAMSVEEEWRIRGQVPSYVFDMMKAMPADTHPMTLFSQAILALQRESVFASKYKEGLRKADYWYPTLEDSLNLTAKLPAIAAYIYNLKIRPREEIDNIDVSYNSDLDWSANFAHMIGIDNPEYTELCRLFFILHSDHEVGNASAHATHLVASTLSDVYYSCSAGMNALAGPLHGLANRECLAWLLDVKKAFNDNLPTKEELQQFVWDTLNKGKVIPGYGHAVLRRPDPRFKAQFEFAKTYLPDYDLFQLVSMVYDVVPDILHQLNKVKNPWPNVDAISGALQYYYGVREFDFYTVMFGVSRILGVTANAIWARALGQPLERPKSVTTSMLEEIARKYRYEMRYK